MSYVYIIYSESIDQYYIGSTSDLQWRIEKHNNHEFEGAQTLRANDWKYVFTLNCVDDKQPLNIEKFIKKMKSRKFNLKLIENGGDWLLERFK